MRIHTRVGITPTILVIVVTIGDGRRLDAGGPCAALCARLARAECAGVNGIAATGVTAPGENATGAVCLLVPRLRACRGSRAARRERPVSAGCDAPASFGVVAAGVDVADAGVVVASAAIVGVVAAGAAVGVVALDRVGMGARAGVVGVAGALPGAAEGAEREIERVAPAVPAACCATGTGTGEVAGTRDVAGWRAPSGRWPGACR